VRRVPGRARHVPCTSRHAGTPYHAPPGLTQPAGHSHGGDLASKSVQPAMAVAAGFTGGPARRIGEFSLLSLDG
jgi:hypothetical protein